MRERLKMYFYFLFLGCLLPSLVTPQSMVMIGGGLDAANDVVYNKMIDLAGGPGAKIGVITIAADNPTTEGQKFVDRFNSYGAQATWIPVTRTSNNANDPAMVALVNQQDGIFFCGGTRAWVLDTLQPDGSDTAVMAAIRDLLRSGGMLAGSSAGMATQSSRVVILTGETYDSVAFKNYTLQTRGGLGTFPGPYMTDAHCSEYGREGRLIRVLFDTKDLPVIGIAQGISIDEDHALVVTNLYNRPLGTVIGINGGIGGVKIFDVSKTVSNPASTTTDLQGTVMSFLSPDDTLDITTGEITIASWKKVLPPSQGVFANAIPANDIFSESRKSGEWRTASNVLIDNRNDDIVTSYSARTSPAKFEVIFDRKNTVAYGGTSPIQGRNYVYSYLNMSVIMREA